MKIDELYHIIKKDLCDLFSYKLYDDAIEISTIHSTVNNKFVSVFIKVEENQQLILSDGGWIDEGLYGSVPDFQNEEILNHVMNFLINEYEVKSKEHPYTGIIFYYKFTNLKMLSADILDMTHFIQSMVNAIHLEYEERKVEEKKRRFAKEVKEYLSKKYDKRIEFGFKANNITFNAKLNLSKEYLLNFITGSNANYYNKNIADTAVKFQMINGQFNKLVIYDDQTEGFIPVKTKPYLDFLETKLKVKTVSWSNKDKLNEILI